MAKSTEKMEKIVSLCKRRGFIFQSSEIYGGIGGFWDYGPLGVELKRNIKDAWWRDMVQNPPIGPDGKQVQMVGVDCSLIMNPKVWEASGHVGGFSDPMVDCKESKGRYRADQINVVVAANDDGAGKMYAYVTGDEETQAKALKNLAKYMKAKTLEPGQYVERPLMEIDVAQFARVVGPHAKEPGSLTEPRAFNLMFQTYVGALQDSSSVAYLRPETAQGIFANFKNVCDSSRVKVPFGIAQIGKAFRNEINPRNYTFRSREFEQMEIEFFCHDSEAMEWWKWWRDTRINWYKSLGLAGENLLPRNQEGDELAHYSKACTDIEYLFPFADEPQELEGVAHRGCFDLTAHQTHSGKDLTYFDDERKERFLPTVIEPSAGADRSTLAFICEAYHYDESRASKEFMTFHPRLAPIKAAILPLVAKDGMPEIAEEIFKDLQKRWPVTIDIKQNIGKRYARMDEAGTPYCFTIDGQTKEDNTVTVRDRDTAGQDRIDKSRIVEYLSDKLGS
ncbi:MAG TPA: glycine--tRNA ligase [Phycisphaerae bacterium]|nr:glycine--tRNA ligase [Phycisphaerae bacterium]HRW52920.1 glycine--tRNA ligase [Phycisphaerae bacterium]